MFFLLSSFLLLGDPIPYQLVRSVDDSIRTERDEYMSRPMGAVFHQGTLYVGDRAHKVFVIDSAGKVRTIGQEGQGPEDFAQYPNHLSITNEGLLKVTGWNSFETTYFKLSGEFVRKDKWSGLVRPFPTWLVEHQMVDVAFDSGYLYRSKSANCLFGSLTEKTSHGWYTTGFTSQLTESGEGHLVVARQSGKVEVYQRNCRLLASTKIVLERFKIDIIPNPLLTKMYKAKGFDVKGYGYGTPVAAIAAKDRSSIWILIRDEPAGLGGKKPDWKFSLMSEVMWLAEVDIRESKPTFLTKLDIPVSSISYANGYLILISDSAAAVRVYEVGK